MLSLRLNAVITRLGCRKMSSRSFIQTLNPLNSKMEWKVIDDDYDFNQEIATSCYGDMLHDDERNKKFGEALKKAIDKFHSSGREANVLDIGTGTGLLSMLAVRYGADSVTACEAFLPMANCANRVIRENNFSDKIKVIKLHSTGLTVGEDGDMKKKANILVSEVFDTELIGEGAIKTFNHAFENLLTEDAIVIPSLGTVFAQIVESDIGQKWNKLSHWKLENCDPETLRVPKAIQDCSGAPAVHDIQLSEFSQDHFKPLSDPIPIFRFNWAKNKKIPTHRQMKSSTNAINSGKAQVVFMWWDLKMDDEGEILLSCAPVWEHPDGKGRGLSVKALTKTLPWRDHWMQGVYFLTREIDLREKDPFTLVSNHDEFSFWFRVETSYERDTIDSSESLRPVCNCGFHFLQSRSRIGALNDLRRRESYLNALKETMTKETVCLVLGDFSLLPLIAAKLGAKKVYASGENLGVEKVYRDFAETNGLTETLDIASDSAEVVGTLRNDTPDLLIISEPYFRNSILPWDNLAFWYGKNELTNALKKASNPLKAVRTFPLRSRLRGCAVEFDNLWKIARPLGECEGFSMGIFDRLIAEAKEKAENYTEAQPLWEYPGIALSEPLDLLTFDFTEDVPGERIRRSGSLEMKWAGRCDGVALWMEYDLCPGHSLGFGPIGDVKVGEYLKWDMYERQGVHLFRNSRSVRLGDSIDYSAEFDPHEAEVNFRFDFADG